MDKDTAGIRNIPQPIDVKEPTKNEEKYIGYKIEQQQPLMVRGEIFIIQIKYLSLC